MAFTRSELAKYDGKGGNPAYVAFQGKVYDVSDIYNSSRKGFPAGIDITDQLDMDEEVRAVLDRGIIVGGLSDG